MSVIFNKLLNALLKIHFYLLHMFIMFSTKNNCNRVGVLWAKFAKRNWLLLWKIYALILYNAKVNLLQLNHSNFRLLQKSVHGPVWTGEVHCHNPGNINKSNKDINQVKTTIISQPQIWKTAISTADGYNRPGLKKRKIVRNLEDNKVRRRGIKIFFYSLIHIFEDHICNSRIENSFMFALNHLFLGSSGELRYNLLKPFKLLLKPPSLQFLLEWTIDAVSSSKKLSGRTGNLGSNHRYNIPDLPNKCLD